MLKKLHLPWLFLSCVPCLGHEPIIEPICNESECHRSCKDEDSNCHSICDELDEERHGEDECKKQNDENQDGLCRATDIVSLNACLAKASLENLIIDLEHANINLTEQISISNSGFSLIIKNGSLVGNNTFGILLINPGSKVKLCKLTVENGHATNGGGIFNLGTLKLRKATLSNNKADVSGGAIYNGPTGIVASRDSLIVDSSASDGSSNNGGGGIFNLGTVAFLSNTTIAGNSTRGFGGGINNQGTIKQICGCTISQNLTCVSIPGSGECHLGQNPTGAGAGIFNESAAVINLLINSTIAKNIALQGGGIFNNGAINALTNSTIAMNKVNFGGGGIYNNTEASIGKLISDIVADNIDTNELTLVAPDIFNNGTISSESYNFIGNNKGVLTIIDGVNNDIVGANPHLLELANNGGPTFTLALSPRSRAINNGLNPFELRFDQRNDPFDRVILGRPDIGAFEFQSFDFCRKPCPVPCPDGDHHHHDQIEQVFNGGFIPMPVPPPPPVPVLVPVPEPVPVLAPVVPVEIPAPVPVALPVDTSITKDNAPSASKFGNAPESKAVEEDESLFGCSTNKSSPSTMLLFLMFFACQVLRKIWLRNKAI